MDSNRKYQETSQASSELAFKIAKEIRSYKIRHALANQEYIRVYEWKQSLSPYDALKATLSEKLKGLQEEINLCTSQIKAYENNDNKAKLIPDRCL